MTESPNLPEPVPEPDTLWSQIYRFLLTGACVVAFDWLCFHLLVHATHDASISNLLSRSLAIPVSFYMQRRFTFRAHEAGHSTAAWLRFLVLWCGGTAFGAVVLEFVRARYGENAASAAKLLVEALIAVVNFVVLRHWVYRRH